MGITRYKGVQNYRTRLKIEQAILLIHSNLEEAANWCGGVVVSEPQASGLIDNHVYVEFPTLYGTDHADVGSYIIKNLNGGFRKADAEAYDEIMEPCASRDDGLFRSF